MPSNRRWRFARSFDNQVAFIEDPDLLQKRALEPETALRQDLASESWGWMEVRSG